jgi:hypothetical protein
MANPLVYFAAASFLAYQGAPRPAMASTTMDTLHNVPTSQRASLLGPSLRSVSWVHHIYIVDFPLSFPVTLIALIMCYACRCRHRKTKEPSKEVLPTYTANATLLQRLPNPYNLNKSVGEAPPSALQIPQQCPGPLTMGKRGQCTRRYRLLAFLGSRGDHRHCFRAPSIANKHLPCITEESPTCQTCHIPDR